MNGNEFDFFRLSNEQKENYIRDLNDIDAKKKLISDPKLDFANLVLLIKSAKNASEMQELTKELDSGQLKQLIVNTQDLSPEEKRFVYCSAPKKTRKTVYKMSSSYDKKVLKSYEKGYKSKNYENFKMSYPEKKTEEKKEAPKEVPKEEKKEESNDKNMEAIRQAVEQKQKQVTVNREKITVNIQNIDRLKNITMKLEKEIAVSEKALAGRMKKKDKKALQAKLAELRQKLTDKQAEIGRLAINNMERAAEIKETEKEIAVVREEMNKQQQAQQQVQQQAQQRTQQQAQQRTQQQPPKQQTQRQQMPRQKDPRQQTGQQRSNVVDFTQRNNRQRQKRTTEEKVKNFEKNAMEMMQFGVVMMPIYINFNDTKMQEMPTPIATIPTTQMVMYPIFVPHVIARQQQMIQQMYLQQQQMYQQAQQQAKGYTRTMSKGYIGIVTIMIILSIIILMMILVLTITAK